MLVSCNPLHCSDHLNSTTCPHRLSAPLLPSPPRSCLHHKWQDGSSMAKPAEWAQDASLYPTCTEALATTAALLVLARLMQVCLPVLQSQLRSQCRHSFCRNKQVPCATDKPGPACGGGYLATCKPGPRVCVGIHDTGWYNNFKYTTVLLKAVHSWGRAHYFPTPTGQAHVLPPFLKFCAWLHEYCPWNHQPTESHPLLSDSVSEN